MENSKERGYVGQPGTGSPSGNCRPCSAETEEQVLKIAHDLKDTDVTYLRAGIWKPRTRPGNFEGVGALGPQMVTESQGRNRNAYRYGSS